MSSLDDAIESILCGVLPGDNQTAFGVETLGLAVAGLPKLPWAAVRLRCLGDRSAMPELWHALTKIALRSESRSARARAGMLASLVLAEDVSPYIGEISPQVLAEAFLLCPNRTHYYRHVRETHLSLRARLDTWAWQGLGRIAARLRG